MVDKVTPKQIDLKSVEWFPTHEPVMFKGNNDVPYQSKKVAELLFEDERKNLVTGYFCTEDGCGYANESAYSVRVHSRTHKRNYRASREKDEMIVKLRAKAKELDHFRIMFEMLPKDMQNRLIKRAKEARVELKPIPPIKPSDSSDSSDSPVREDLGPLQKIILALVMKEFADQPFSAPDVYEKTDENNFPSQSNDRLNAVSQILLGLASKHYITRVQRGVYMLNEK